VSRGASSETGQGELSTGFIFNNCQKNHKNRKEYGGKNEKESEVVQEDHLCPGDHVPAHGNGALCQG
jgi:hypothetical protein